MALPMIRPVVPATMAVPVRLAQPVRAMVAIIKTKSFFM
jgi:hypothetical protein